jgi:hypothetical protein
MRRFLLFCISILTTSAYAQRVENIKAVVLGDGEKVIITYDITGASEGQKFKVTLYSSHNNFASPLSLVNGDVGRDRELPPGLGKRIEWSAKDELKEFVGDVTFEVRAELVATFFVDSPAIGSKVKKGKTLNITWKGGSPGESMRLDLMKGGAVIAQIASVQNNQRFAWVVPKTMDKGSDYQVRLTGDSGSAMSGNFGIKSKTPFMLKILPVVAVGGIAYLVLGGKEKKESDLPKPPEPN